MEAAAGGTAMAGTWAVTRLEAEDVSRAGMRLSALGMRPDISAVSEGRGIEAGKNTDGNSLRLAGGREME